MASVYKSVSKTKPSSSTKPRDDNDPDKPPKNRQRLLLLSSRGVTYRHRHLLADLHALLPHSRKDAKLDTKTRLHQLNELADLYNCNNILFFEARKAQDLYLWLAKPPNGPTVKLHAQNVHTMEELNFAGNCLRGSRPVLSFDRAFEQEAHWRVVKEVLTQSFGVPLGSRKVKPFVDHVMGFTLVGGKIWVRCYQIVEQEAGKKKVVATAEKEGSGEKEGEAAATATKTTTTTMTTPSTPVLPGQNSLSLLEIGPRFVLTPIVILEGSFGGPVIYENKEFISPNQIRSDLRKAKAGRYGQRADDTRDRKARHRDLGLRSGEGPREVDELDTRVVFA